jgi:AcrR family transcriptional regulator
VKVSIVLRRQKHMEPKERIIKEARGLFFRVGIRSVTMDDIAAQVGMSKKTLYQHFADKDELVDNLVDGEIGLMQNETMECINNSANAIEEIFISMEMANKHFTKMNPMVLFDLHKFHFNSFQKFMDHKNTFLMSVITDNLKRGLTENLYRTDTKIDIMAKYRLQMLMLPFDMEAYPPMQYNLIDVSNAMIENFLYGLSTEKGYKLIEQYKKERKSNEQ